MKMSLSSFATIGEAKRALIAGFKGLGLDTAELDARLLIMNAAGMSRTDLITRINDRLTDNQREAIKALALRRIAGEPVDHILGVREFYGREFKITKDVLSPRPETEMLVDEVLKFKRGNPKVRILELGTGSGAIIISILAEIMSDSISATATDISDAALKIARENAKTYNLLDHIEFIQGSWFEPVTGQYDIIISNPPYITNSTLKNLQPEVIQFDPGLALNGGEDGLEAYRSIIFNAKDHLSELGKILFEIGFDQATSVLELLKQVGFKDVRVKKDLAGHDRLVMANKPS